MTDSIVIGIMSAIDLNFKTLGEGPPVIILHGFLGMLDNWKTFGRKLSEKYQVFLVDQRDHGRSPHTDDFSYDLLAEDLHDFMDAQNLESAFLIGHSMGGKTVMRFMQKYPSMVKRAIVVDMAPFKNDNHHNHILDALNSFDPASANARSDGEEHLLKSIPDIGVVQFLMKNMNRRKEGGFQWKMNLDLLTSKYDEILEATDSQISEVPTLFVAGGKSNYIPAYEHEEILRLFPLGKIQTIEDAGHWVHAEKPEELLELCIEWMQKA